MAQPMIGVVLWSDPDKRQAIIWCEDQGDLAIMEAHDAPLSPAFDAGDLIRFDCEEKNRRRAVRNPEMLSRGHSPELARTLRSAARPAAAATPEGGATILPFRARRRVRPETLSA